MIFNLFFGFVLVGVSQARSTSEIQAWFLEHAVECSNHHPVTGEEMLMLKNHRIPDSTNVKCLLACVMRKTNFINDQGNFDVEKAIKWATKEFSDDAKQLENSKTIYDICKTVNDEEVTDGEKGCDRALYLTKCLIENGPKNGFVLVPME